jgi:hypothetical protein
VLKCDWGDERTRVLAKSLLKEGHGKSTRQRGVNGTYLCNLEDFFKLHVRLYLHGDLYMEGRTLVLSTSPVLVATGKEGGLTCAGMANDEVELGLRILWLCHCCD